MRLTRSMRRTGPSLRRCLSRTRSRTPLASSTRQKARQSTPLAWGSLRIGRGAERAFCKRQATRITSEYMFVSLRPRCRSRTSGLSSKRARTRGGL